MGLMEQQAVDRAFRAGLLEAGDGKATGLSEDSSLGAGELLVLGTKRLPGIDDPEAAYETGRVLRLIARLFDAARAPAVISEQLRDNLQAAIMSHHMRRSGKSWRCRDTIDMFIEMYERVMTPKPEELQVIRQFLETKSRKPADRASETRKGSAWGFGWLKAA
ncbi:MAG: hypothetical protein R3C97_11860 [Geminicoccaceae bacterium]